MHATWSIPRHGSTGTHLKARFKKSVESGTIRSISNRLRANRVDTDTRYETMSGSVKTR